MTPENERDTEQIINLTAVVVDRTYSERDDNNFKIEWFEIEEQETGTSWTNYEIEATLLLTDAPQNSGYCLQKLRLYDTASMHDSNERRARIAQNHLQQVAALTPGSTVNLKINYVDDYAWPATKLDLNEMREMTKLGMKANLVQVRVLSPNLA